MWCETDERGTSLRRLDKVSRSPLGSFEVSLSGLGGSLHWLDHTIRSTECVFMWMACCALSSGVFVQGFWIHIAVHQCGQSKSQHLLSEPA